MYEWLDPLVAAIGRLDGSEVARASTGNFADDLEDQLTVHRAEQSADDHLRCEGAPSIWFDRVADGHHACLRRGRPRVHGLLLETANSRSTSFPSGRETKCLSPTLPDSGVSRHTGGPKAHPHRGMPASALYCLPDLKDPDERIAMTDVSLEELGPVDYMVVEFPAGASNF